MVALLFVLVMFNSVIIAMGCVIYATTVRKLRKEVNKLKEENKNLKDENHSLRCSEQSLLWQRENLRNEVIKLIINREHLAHIQELKRDNFSKVSVWDESGKKVMTFQDAWEKAAKMVYNWS